jgi:hypothetical protein
MCGDGEVQDASALVREDQEHVEDLEPDRWHSEEVNRHRGLDVTLKEGAPSLGGRPTMTHHVLAYAGLDDVDAELQ